MVSDHKVKARGSVTIYLSLMLALVLAFVCTVVESARVNTINARLKSITYMAADSTFSQYAKEMFEEYKIMGLWKDDYEFSRDFNDFIEKNLTLDDRGIYQWADLYHSHLIASAVLEMKKLTDDNGRIFGRQVEEYMEVFMIKELLEKILESLDIFREGSHMSAFIGKIVQYQDVFIKVGNCVSAIQSNVDRAKSLAYNPSALLGDMKESIKLYAKEQIPVYATRFYNDYMHMTDGKDELNICMDNIISNTSAYYGYADEAEAAIQELDGILDQEEGDYSEETFTALKEQLGKLKMQTASESRDFYGIEDNESAAYGIKKSLSGLDGLSWEIEALDDPGDIESLEGSVDYYERSLAGFNLSGLGLENSGSYVKKENSGFLSTIGDIFTKGLLEAVTSGNISEKKADTRNFPSVSMQWGYSEESMGKIIMSEYILNHFGNYAEEKKDTALKYETEYILGGKSSDRDNLSKTVRDVVLLRSGLNMISFMKDTEKLAQADALALGIIGFTGMQALVETVKMLIISTWCLAESLCDVKTLLAGGKVAAVKESYDWTISAIGLKNFTKTVVPSANDDNGFGYREYLRVLLLMQDGSTLAYRAMDMIQANMCLRYNPDFRMDQCISKVKMIVQYEAGQVFTLIPFVRNILGNNSGGYSFRYVQAYEY